MDAVNCALDLVRLAPTPRHEFSADDNFGYCDGRSYTVLTPVPANLVSTGHCSL